MYPPILHAAPNGPCLLLFLCFYISGYFFIFPGYYDLGEVSYWSVLCLDHIIQDCIYSDICYCLYIREKYSSCDLHLDLASTRIISLYLPWRSRGKQEIL